ncbi:hypothetical protein ACFT7S_11305 [Streptomyces sp. NPDC057136]|uniref:hypothetical protein n=1 Tax=Streptomyces sp. NPDC057136 TaxID=3346029 RepID=UPI0036444AFF
MTAADLFFTASIVAEVLAWTAAVFAPGLLLAALHHLAKRAAARRAWAATTRTVAAEYEQAAVLDDLAHHLDAYAERVMPLYGMGE